MASSEEILKNRILELGRQAKEGGYYTNTSFLSPAGQELCHSVKAQLAVPFTLEGGREAAVRKLAVFGSAEEFGYEWDTPVRILHIRPKSRKFGEALSHRDVLGAVMSLGIERRLTGDIVVREKEAWIFALDSAVEFLTENLTQIRHTLVVCEEEKGPVPALEPRFEVIRANVASERLDLILSAAAKIRREDAKKLLNAEKVFINERLVTSPGHKLREGDVLVLRGFGKFIFDGTQNTTARGRLNVALRKYV